MAVGMSQYLANNLLDAVCNNVSFAVAQVYIQFHVGDPGAAGTANQAGNTTRRPMSFGAPATGAITSDTDTVWTAVSTSETYTHYSAWDAASAGNFLWSDVGTFDPVTATEDFTIPTGDGDLTFALAS